MESVDYQPSVEMCFVAVESLERAGRMSWDRVSRSITVAVQTEGKRRTVACTEAISCSWVKIGLKSWELTVV